MKFLFGDIVVVEGNLIGVIVKSWQSLMHGYYYEVYVRNYNCIKNMMKRKLKDIKLGIKN